jgi:hypothetical protein
MDEYSFLNITATSLNAAIETLDEIINEINELYINYELPTEQLIGVEQVRCIILKKREELIKEKNWF